MKKKLIQILAMALGICLLTSACTKNTTDAPTSSNKRLALNVGATALPHAEILAMVKDDLAAEGVDLTITEFGDYTLMNPALSEGQIDANFFQHQPYLDDYVKNSGQKLVSVGKIHIEPMGIYSHKITKLDELKDGSIVGVPNDATNEGRAFLLLAHEGLITLKDNVGSSATVNDIKDNPKHLEWKELEASVLPRTLDETDISVINTNYALEADLNPTHDALAMEDSTSPYANIIVVNEKDKDSEAVLKLVKALQSEKIRKFINETYAGAIVPVF